MYTLRVQIFADTNFGAFFLALFAKLSPTKLSSAKYTNYCLTTKIPQKLVQKNSQIGTFYAPDKVFSQNMCFSLKKLSLHLRKKLFKV